MAYELGHEDVGPPQLLASLFDERVRARVPTLTEEARCLGARAACVLLIQKPVDRAPATLEERSADRRLPHMECMCSVHGSCAPSARVQETGRGVHAVYVQCICRVPAAHAAAWARPARGPSCRERRRWKRSTDGGGAAARNAAAAWPRGGTPTSRASGEHDDGSRCASANCPTRRASGGAGAH